MADAGLERLKLLYDYEKFHIGLYGAMITGFIAILSVWTEKLTLLMVLALGVAIILLLVAAICGAILASSVIDVYNNYNIWSAEIGDDAGPNSFWRKRIGPGRSKCWETSKWWRLGHGSFWAAVFIVVGMFLGHLVYWVAKGQLPN